MKLQIIYQNRINSKSCKSNNHGGFIMIEILLAFSLFTILTISTFTLSLSMQSLREWSIKELDKMKVMVRNMDSGVYEKTYKYGNDTQIFSNSLFTLSKSDYDNAWGRNTCHPRLSYNLEKIKYYTNGVDIGYSNPSTDLEARNGYVYLTTDSTISSSPDFYIINIRDPENPLILSSLNTGPGLSAIEVAGPYVFVARASTVSQLQIIDIHDRTNPIVISELKLPLPTSSTTAPFATSIFYHKGYVYLGTTKWNGAEFSVINVDDVRAPIVVGQFETGTLINDIYVRDDIVFLATSDEKQVRVLNISDTSNPTLINSFSPSGWQTQEGKTIEYFEGGYSLGRTVGGFNVLTNYEIYSFITSDEDGSINFDNNIRKDIPGGVYGILFRPEMIIILTHMLNKELQIFNSTLSTKLLEIPLESQPVRMACDGTNLVFATGDSRAITILKLNE